MLLIITPGFPKDEQDSACLPPIQQFVLALQSQYPAAQITILSLQYPFQKKNYQWHGSTVVAFGGKNKLLKKFYIWFLAYQALKKIHKKNQIQCILSLWLGETALIAQFFGKINKVKRYFWLHGQDVRSGNKYVKFIRPKKEQLIAISEFSANQFEKNYGRRPFMIAENGILSAFFPLLNTVDRGHTILGVGSLIALKNYTLFLELIAELIPSYPSLNVMLIGAGPELKMLIEKRTSLGLEKEVTFTGTLDHAEVLKQMNKAKVFLHTSKFEGSSTVLAEALYSGCLVVSSIALKSNLILNMCVADNKQDLKLALLNALASSKPSERILSHDMKDTAKQILSLIV